MDSNTSTGTFRIKLPPDLLSALKNSPIEDPGKDMELHAMKPSLFERVWALISGFRPRR